MTRFLNKHKIMTVQTVASVVFLGLVSVSVASPVQRNEVQSCKKSEYDFLSEQSVQPLNTQVVLNSIGYRVPVSYYK